MALIDTLREQHNAIVAGNKARIATAEAESRGLTVEEFDAVRADNVLAADLEQRIAEIEKAEAREAAVPPALVQSAKVVREERTYNPDAEKRGVSFLGDMLSAQLDGDPEARQRLITHKHEERIERGELRAVGTSAFAGLTVPQYLTDLVAPTARARRPLADICMVKHPMPAAGMTVNISRITTGSSAALQSAQADAVSETNMDDTLLTINVQTLAGQQTVSRQAIERGTGIEQVVLGDLIGAYNTTLDSTLITQATTGLNALTDANVDVAYTDASPTVAELWPKLADMIQQIQSAVYAGASHLVMHPRRWWWLVASVGTSFPFLQVAASAQAGGSLTSTQYGGVVGNILGLPVVCDANVATTLGGGTEDAIYAVTRDEAHLWEDSAMFIRAEQTNAATLGVLLVVYGYVAYTFGRYPSAHGRVAGTGLAAPSF